MKILWDELVEFQLNPILFVISPDPKSAHSYSSVAKLQTEVRDKVIVLATLATQCLKDRASTACDGDPTLKFSDYEYRLQMPVRKDLLRSNLLIEQLMSHAIRAQEFAAKCPDDNCRNSAMNSIRHINIQVRNIADSWKEFAKEAVEIYWLKRPAALRCKVDINDEGCLTSSQVEEYLKRVPDY